MPSANMETFLKLKDAADMANDLTSEKAQQAMWDAYSPDFEIVEPPLYRLVGSTRAGTAGSR